MCKDYSKSITYPQNPNTEAREREKATPGIQHDMPHNAPTCRKPLKAPRRAHVIALPWRPLPLTGDEAREGPVDPASDGDHGEDVGERPLHHVKGSVGV